MKVYNVVMWYPLQNDFWVFFFFFLSITALQCCVSFCCMMIKKCVEDLNRHFSKESIRWQEVYETMLNVNNYCCCGSAIKLWLTLCDPIECSMPCFHVLHCLPEFVQSHVHWVGDVCNHLVLCHLLLLLPSIFPSIGVFSNESALHIMWPGAQGHYLLCSAEG